MTGLGRSGVEWKGVFSSEMVWIGVEWTAGRMSGVDWCGLESYIVLASSMHLILVINGNPEDVANDITIQRCLSELVGSMAEASHREK